MKTLFPELNETRIRPVHAVRSRVQDFLSKSDKVKTISVGPGIALRYVQSRWKLIGPGSYVQSRDTWAGVYRDSDAQSCLVAAFGLFETRNALSEWLHMDSYLQECDSISSVLDEHAQVVGYALEQLKGSKPEALAPKEAFVEITELWISEQVRGSLIWALPLNALLHKVCSTRKTHSAIVLRAMPMEYAKFFGHDFVDPTPAQKKILDKHWKRRCQRIAAMGRLYRYHLGFQRIDAIGEYWMTAAPPRYSMTLNTKKIAQARASAILNDDKRSDFCVLWVFFKQYCSDCLALLIGQLCTRSGLIAYCHEVALFQTSTVTGCRYFPVEVNRQS